MSKQIIFLSIIEGQIPKFSRADPLNESRILISILLREDFDSELLPEYDLGNRDLNYYQTQ